MKDHSIGLKISRNALFCLIIIIMGYPLFWSFSSAIKTNAQIVAEPYGLPVNPSYDNLTELWVKGEFLRYLFNSLVTSLASVTGIVAMTTMAGFAFCRRNSRAFDLMFAIILAGMMIPREIIIIPVFKIIADLGLRNSLLALILVYLTWTPFGTFLMKTYFLTLPVELGESARIDGCTEFGVFWRIYLPLATPAIATVAIFGFIWTWNDFLWPLILVHKQEWFTIQVGVLLFQNEFMIDWARRLAGLAFAIFPPLVLYLIFNRGIQKGLSAGAIKL